MDKKTARELGLRRRSLIPEEERKRRCGDIPGKLFPLIGKYEVIGCYVSFRDEPQTRDIIRYCLENGKTLAVPKVTEDTLAFHEIGSENDLSPGCFGISEPEGGRVIDPEEIGLMIVPLSSFDSTGMRTGYGKGFYDRILTDRQMKVGIAFAEQQVDVIEADPWDVRLDAVVKI